MTLSFQAFGYVSNSTEEEILKDRAFYKDMTDSAFKMVPIDWNAYKVKIMNNGRMIRLVNKTDPDFSPISYTYGKDDYSSVAPIFSLINDRFVVVL